MSDREQDPKVSQPIPEDLTDAYDKVQELYGLEDTVGAVRTEFFGLKNVQAFATIGRKSAWHDSILWAGGYVLCGGIVYYIQDNYLAEKTMTIFDWTLNCSLYYLLTKIASFGYLAGSTGICIWMSRYYAYTVSKKAINSLFAARMMFLFIFAFATFVTLGFLNRYVFTESNLLYVFRPMYKMFPDTALRLYAFFMGYFKRSLFESAVVSVVASLLSAVLPTLTMIFFGARKRRHVIMGED